MNTIKHKHAIFISIIIKGNGYIADTLNETNILTNAPIDVCDSLIDHMNDNFNKKSIDLMTSAMSKINEMRDEFDNDLNNDERISFFEMSNLIETIRDKSLQCMK